MARTEGAIGIVQRQLHRFTKEIVTRDQYEEIINVLIDIAINGKKDSDRLKAIQLIQERLEGRLPETIQHTVNGGLSARDLLTDDNQ